MLHLRLCSVWYARIPLSTTRTSLPGVDSVGSRHERCGVAYARSVQVVVMPEVFARDMSWSCFYRLCYLLTDNCHSSCCPRSCAHRIYVYLSLARSLSLSLPLSRLPSSLSPSLSSASHPLFSLSLSLSRLLSTSATLYSLSLSLVCLPIVPSISSATVSVSISLSLSLSLSLVFLPPSILSLSRQPPSPSLSSALYECHPLFSLSRLLSTSATLYSLSLPLSRLSLSLSLSPTTLYSLSRLSSRSNTGYERVRFQCSASGSSRRVA